MRPWLVVIGVVFLTLAGGTMAVLFFGGDGNPTTVVTPYPSFNLGSNETEYLPLDGSNGTSEQFSLVWHATSPIGVTLVETEPCSLNCSLGLTLVSWSSSTSGTWTGTGPFRYPLHCELRNNATQTVSASLTGRAVASTPTHFGLEVEVILGSGAAALLLVGGLAIFLGLFLRGNPYGPRPSLTSPSAEESEELSGGPPPGH